MALQIATFLFLQSSTFSRKIEVLWEALNRGLNALLSIEHLSRIVSEHYYKALPLEIEMTNKYLTLVISCDYVLDRISENKNITSQVKVQIK